MSLVSFSNTNTKYTTVQNSYHFTNKITLSRHTPTTKDFTTFVWNLRHKRFRHYENNGDLHMRAGLMRYSWLKYNVHIQIFRTISEKVMHIVKSSPQTMCIVIEKFDISVQIYTMKHFLSANFQSYISLI